MGATQFRQHHALTRAQVRQGFRFARHQARGWTSPTLADDLAELEALLQIQQPTLSQQLGGLREEGLVSTRREGKQIFYKIESREATAIMQVLYELFCQPGKGETT